MPTEDEYGSRRQVNTQHASTSPAPVSCPAGCPAGTTADRFASYGSEKALSDHFDGAFQASPADRFGGPERSHSDRLPSGERYQGSSERYPLGDRPQTALSSDRLASHDRPATFQPERYHYSTNNCQRYTLDRYHNNLDRYSRTSTPTDRYLSTDKAYQTNEFNASTQSVCSDRYAPSSRANEPSYHNSKTLPSEVYKYSTTGTKDSSRRYRYDQYMSVQADRFPPSDRFPPIPCPERFASGQERNDRFNQYMEPPSPAPSSDRFIPPPPLSPTNTPSPNEVYPATNPFPSPTTTVPPERFIPPPPLSPSPTESYPAKNYDKRYPYAERYYRNGAAFYNEALLKSSQSGYPSAIPPERYSERYHQHQPVPPNAHTPVDRYVPQQQEHYYYYTERYQNQKFDPYMRRDLGYHYRLPVPYPQNQQFQQRMRYTSGRIKCCSYEGVNKNSPGSSSSSSVTSQQGNQREEPQCQNYSSQQQEKGVQCNKEQFKDSSPGLRKCRHGMCASPSVEYMGASGGRHVCATPPPRGGSNEGLCTDQCCGRKTSLTVWRSTNTQSPPAVQQQPKPPTPPPPLAEPPGDDNEQRVPPSPKPSPIQRTVSMPAPAQPSTSASLHYSQSERNVRDRPQLRHSQSKKDLIKKYLRRETATFFGVCEDNECVQQERWLDRRKRLASRTYGALKDESELPTRLRRAVSEVSRSTALSHLQKERPDVLPGPSDVPDSQDNFDEEARSKDSVARMTWDGLSYVVTTLTRHKSRERTPQWSRSYPPDVPAGRLPTSESIFFGRPHSISPSSPDATDRVSPDEAPLRPSYLRSHLTRGWRRDPHSRGEQAVPTVGGSRISASVLDRVLDNSDRRQYGMGWVGKVFGRRYRKSVTHDVHVRQQLDDLEDYRPMFTYWVSTVQVLIMIIAIICYGFGPFGLDLQARSGQVLVPSLSLQQVDYLEPANFWFGPRAADLIHLGAKFSPCMRIDNKIMQQIEKTRAKERETACCIRNDDSGCVQSSQADCSKTISTWKKWSAGESGPGGRISGSVCGLDPKFCDAPASVHPYEWPDDITKWPICRKTNTQSSIQKPDPRDRIAEHMVCEVIGHPCCIGIHGQCKITTREYCDFVRGTFHEEASLCSQVSCLNDVCGMIPFYFFEIPDQFYRLWTSLFLHAGVLQLAVTLLIQYFLMRDLEKLTGSLRIAIIYIGSGVAGNLASAIFVPYRAEVGPAGSQFGLLACLIVEVLNAWPMLRHPNQALCKLLTITGALFVIGLMPWVDNYAHLFGFVFGFLLSYALLPFISFGPYERQKKILLIWVCLLSASFLFICLVLLFYIFPVYDCRLCSYFNCLPVTQDFCASQNINFMREEPVV